MPARNITDSDLVFPEGKKPGWVHTKAGMDGGQFGQVVHIAVCKPDGTFLFDKPVIEEGSHVITLTYGFLYDDRSGVTPVLALVKEQRDTAAELDGTDAPVFWGPPRGYAEQTDDGLMAAAMREAGEETGANVLVGEPWIVTRDTVPNETIVRSRSPWVAIPVDVRRLGEIRADHGEKIFKAEFFSVEEIEIMIAAGSYDGASTESWCLMAALTLFRVHVLPKLRRPEMLT